MIEERIFFITYSDEALFEVFSCDTDGKDMKSLGSISVDYNPKYAYIEGYHISEEYVTLWGDMGVGDSATDIAVLSLENGEVTEHSFDLYSRTFAVCNGYGFITFTREYYDPIADPDISPMENEGIYKIDLITGEKEIISNELAFNSELFAFDENCVYAISYSVNQISNQYTYHISRVRAGEDATLVYNYKQ